MKWLVFLILVGLADALEKKAEPRVVTRSLYSWFDQKAGDLVLKGNASIERDGVILRAEEIYYNEAKKEAFATNQTRLESKEFNLEAGQLKVYLPGNRTFSQMLENDMVVIAQKAPRLTEKPGPDGTYSQITAVEIKFFKASEKVEAFENVRMLQLKNEGLTVAEEMVVTGAYLEYLHKQKKALVKQDVKLTSKELGAEGQRLIYYQNDGRFYIVDDAKVFQYDENGKVKDTVAGNKILHILKEKRTILMGNVEGTLGPN